MARSHVKYNGGAYAQYKISCDEFIRETHSSTCVQKKILMTRLHMEHIWSACLQDRTSRLVCPIINHNFFQLK